MTDNIHRFLFRLSRLFHGLRAPGVGDALQLVRGARSVSASPPALTCLAYIKVPVSPDHEQCVTRQTAKNGVRSGAAEEAHGGGGGHGRL